MGLDVFFQEKIFILVKNQGRTPKSLNSNSHLTHLIQLTVDPREQSINQGPAIVCLLFQMLFGAQRAKHQPGLTTSNIYLSLESKASTRAHINHLSNC